MKIISEVFNVDYKVVKYMNFVYEMFASDKIMCIGIICRDKNGEILSGRNVDYFMWE